MKISKIQRVFLLILSFSAYSVQADTEMIQIDVDLSQFVLDLKKVGSVSATTGFPDFTEFSHFYAGTYSFVSKSGRYTSGASLPFRSTPEKTQQHFSKNSLFHRLSMIRKKEGLLSHVTRLNWMTAQGISEGIKLSKTNGRKGAQDLKDGRDAYGPLSSETLRHIYADVISALSEEIATELKVQNLPYEGRLDLSLQDPMNWTESRFTESYNTSLHFEWVGENLRVTFPEGKFRATVQLTVEPPQQQQSLPPAYIATPIGDKNPNYPSLMQAQDQENEGESSDSDVTQAQSTPNINAVTSTQPSRFQNTAQSQQPVQQSKPTQSSQPVKQPLYQQRPQQSQKQPVQQPVYQAQPVSYQQPQSAQQPVYQAQPVNYQQPQQSYQQPQRVYQQPRQPVIVQPQPQVIIQNPGFGMGGMGMNSGFGGMQNINAAMYDEGNVGRDLMSGNLQAARFDQEAAQADLNGNRIGASIDRMEAEISRDFGGNNIGMGMGGGFGMGGFGMPNVGAAIRDEGNVGRDLMMGNLQAANLDQAAAQADLRGDFVDASIDRFEAEISRDFGGGFGGFGGGGSFF